MCVIPFRTPKTAPVPLARLLRCAAAAAGLWVVPTHLHAQEVAKESRTHVVKTGDTLWELAQIYLSDPFLWPEIYRINTDVVEDPHWIFPGEVLRVPGPGTGTPELQVVGDETLPAIPVTQQEPLGPTTAAGPTIFTEPPRRPRASGGGRMTAGTQPRAEVRRGEYLAAPWVERNGGPRGAGRIVASADIAGIAQASERRRFQFNDRLYVTLPTTGVVDEGDRFVVFALGPKLTGLGQVVIPTGIVEIIEPHRGREASVARLVEQYDEVMLEQGLLPLEELQMAPGVRPASQELGLTSRIVWVRDQPVVPGIQTYVVVDATLQDGLSPGDQLTLYRPRRSSDRGVVLPEQRIAVAQVVRVTPFGTTAMIIDIEQPAVKEGTHVRVTARMP